MRRWHLIALGIGLGLVLYGVFGDPMVRGQTPPPPTFTGFAFTGNAALWKFTAHDGTVYQAISPGMAEISSAGAMYYACAKATGPGADHGICPVTWATVW